MFQSCVAKDSLRALCTGIMYAVLVSKTCLRTQGISHKLNGSQPHQNRQNSDTQSCWRIMRVASF